VIHTYRDADVFRSRYWERPLPRFLSLGVIPLFLFGPLAAGWFPFSWPVAGAAAAFTVLSVIAEYNQLRREQYGNCGEIRLDDDGTCELETKRRVIRLHANEIRSVAHWPESDETSESYTIYYQGGKLRVAKRMTDFHDFLSRLKTLNPAANLPGFPADTWPDLGGQGAEKPGYARRFLQSALFPLIVITVLVYLATQTFAK